MAGKTIEATLRIATQVAEAVRDLQSLRKEIVATRDAGKQTGAGNAVVTQETKAAQEAAAAQAKASRDAARAEALAEREAATARRQARRQELEEQQRVRAAERKANAERLAEQQKLERTVRASANLQTQAYRQLPAQITDVVTSLASGSPAYLVAIQQGGQLRDSFGGFGATLRALLSLLTPVRLAVGGVATVMGGLAVATFQGWRETDRLNKAFALTGDVGVASLGRINSLATQISADTGAAIGGVRDTLTALVQAGQDTSTTLEASARAVTAYRRLTGASAEEAVQVFNGQRDAILDWSVKANKAYNFLTAAQVGYIRQLQAQGRVDEAARFANEELAKTLEQRSVPAIGALERAWKGVLGAVSAVIDKARGIGRETTIDDQIASLRQQLQAGERLRENMRLRGQPVAGKSPEEEQLEAQLQGLELLRNRQLLRAAEREAQQKAESEKALQESKSFQDALAAVDQAGLQKRLALRLAALDREQSAVELSREQQLISEQEAALQLGAIEQRRLQAQADAVRRRIEIERSRVVERPEDVQAKQAAVIQLEAQLVDLQSRLDQAAGKAQQQLAADARQQAEEWRRAWLDAAASIRSFAQENAANAAELITDPQARARASAAAATDDQARDLAAQQKALQLRIDLTLDPAQVASLQAQLDQLSTEGATALSERTRRAQFESLQQQFSEQTSVLAQQEQELDDLVQRGAISTEEAEARKLEARAGSVDQLQQILALMEALAKTPAERAQIASARAIAASWADVRTEIEKAARQSAVQELAGALNDITTGAKSAGDALRDAVVGFGKAILNLLNQRLAEKLVNLIAGSGGSGTKTAGTSGGGGGGDNGLGAFVSWIVSLFHTGGVVGRGMSGMARSVAPLAFAGAQVLHSGGIAGMSSGLGLKSNERAAVLEVGEEVLTADDPRHINNFKGAGMQVSMGDVNISGAGGTEADQRRAAAQLQRQMVATIQQWAADQSRQGGIFSGGRRG